MKMNLRMGIIAVSLLTVVGCHTDMWVQPKARVQGESDLFEDGKSSRGQVVGTVARGQQMMDEGYSTGYQNGKLVPKLYAEKAMTSLELQSYRDLILRGKERYGIFCSHCHGAIGDGNGMIAQRGLTLERPVATYHTDRMRTMPDGHIFDAISGGYGVMKPMAYMIDVPDRWAIVAYVRALQRQQAPDAEIGPKSTAKPVPVRNRISGATKP